MSRTVSFRASEELDDFLEREAERRLTTKSTVVQMIVAEHFQEVKAERQEEGGEETALPEDPEKDAPETDQTEIGEVGESEEEEEEPDALDRNPDAWYLSSGEKKYAVYVPEDADTTDAGKRRYYVTRAGAAKGIERWYE